MVHRCPNCDTTVQADARFCSSCGHDPDSETGLTEAELDRIEEEEEFRGEVRQDIQRRQLRNGCLGVLVLMALVAVCTVVVFGGTSDPTPAATAPAAPSQAQAPLPTPVPLLEIQNFTCTRDKDVGSAYIEGRVKNLSPLALDQVFAFNRVAR